MAEVNDETAETKPDTEVVVVDAPSGGDAAEVNKALASVAAMVETVAKAAGVKLDADGVDDDAAGEQDTTKGKKAKAFDPRAMFGKQLKSAGVTGEDATKAMTEFDKAFTPFKPGAAAEKPTAKAAAPEAAPTASEAPAENSDIEDTTKALEALEQAIVKAKRFTPKREAALKAAVEQLQKLLGEMTSVPQGSNPSTGPGSSTTFGASGVQTLTKAIEDLTQQVTKSVEQGATNAAKIEAIEKARGPATALDDNATDDVVDTKKSFWGGLL